MLTEFLIKQSQKPSGLIGRVITKIWSFYFKKLSLWAIKQTTISDNYRIFRNWLRWREYYQEPSCFK